MRPNREWVTVWVKQNGPLKSGPKSSENKEKPLISGEISGDLSYVNTLDAIHVDSSFFYHTNFIDIITF